MIHEAVVWSDLHKKWYFLPRKASKSKYNDVDDERHGTNFLLVAGKKMLWLIFFCFRLNDALVQIKTLSKKGWIYRKTSMQWSFISIILTKYFLLFDILSLSNLIYKSQGQKR